MLEQASLEDKLRVDIIEENEEIISDEVVIKENNDLEIKK